MLKDTPARYHPLQVTFHWLVVAMLFSMFVLGKYMTGLPNDSAKLLPLGLHIALGIATVVIIIARFIARLRLPQPAPAHTGNAFLDLLGRIVHYALYLLVLLMAISGISLSLRAGLLPIVFGNSGAALPPDLMVYSARMLHGFVAPILLGTVLLHIGAALYHQLLLKDHIFRRMSFEKKQAATLPEKTGEHVQP
jgi:cytochrome b561